MSIIVPSNIQALRTFQDFFVKTRFVGSPGYLLERVVHGRIFNWVPLTTIIALGQLYNVRENPSVILQYTYNIVLVEFRMDYFWGANLISSHPNHLEQLVSMITGEIPRRSGFFNNQSESLTRTIVTRVK